MLKTKLCLVSTTFVRYSSEGNKRFMQTIPASSKRSPVASFGNLNYQLNTDLRPPPRAQGNQKWAKHSLTFPQSLESPRLAKSQQDISFPSKPEITLLPPVRKSRVSRFRKVDTDAKIQKQKSDQASAAAPETAAPAAAVDISTTTSQEQAPAKKPRRQLRPRKALISLSPSAVEHLKGLLDQPTPQLIRIGVKNRGCSGLTYHLEYVSEPGKFDETVEQDGVKVLIDSKALFSIVGSEMDWLDDKLSSRFIFKNPNSKGTCGCGESFMV